MDTLRGRGVLETILTVFEAKSFTLNANLSFMYIPSISTGMFMSSMKLETTSGKAELV